MSNSCVEQKTVLLETANISINIKGENTTSDIFDLDLSAVALDTNDKLLTEKSYIFYNNLCSIDNSIEHMGDNISTGSNKETIRIDFKKVDPLLVKIKFFISTHKAVYQDDDISKIKSIECSIMATSTDAVLSQCTLEQHALEGEVVCIGELKRDANEWSFTHYLQQYTISYIELISSFLDEK